jgi:hypothetical protein
MKPKIRCEILCALQLQPWEQTVNAILKVANVLQVRSRNKEENITVSTVL